MQKNHEIYPYLYITGFKDSPEEIAQELGVTPSKIWNKGDIKNPKTGKVYENSGIHIVPDIDKSADFENQLSSLLSIVNRKEEQFIKICNSCYTELRCVIYLYHDSDESTPAVHFDKQALQILAALGAEVDIDLYAL